MAIHKIQNFFVDSLRGKLTKKGQAVMVGAIVSGLLITLAAVGAYLAATNALPTPLQSLNCLNIGVPGSIGAIAGGVSLVAAGAIMTISALIHRYRLNRPAGQEVFWE